MVQQPQLEIKKMKQGMSYSCKEKTIILNVFKYFCAQFPDKCVTEIVRRTSKATGCSEKSIFQFRKEEASSEGFKEPSKTKIRKNININSRDIKYDATVRQAIRHVIYDLKYKNIVPSLNNILKQINLDSQLPNFSLMTLRRLMFDMGFYYEKNGNKSVLVEKPNAANAVVNNKATNTKKITNENHIISNTTVNQKTLDYDKNKVDVLEQKGFKKMGEQTNGIDVNNKMVQPHVSHAQPGQPNHLQVGYVTEPEGHRLLTMHLPPPPENHMVAAPMHPPPHGMAMMINNKRELIPSHPVSHNIDLSVKREVHPAWMYQHNNMVKQQSDMNLSLERKVPPWMYPPPNSMVKQQ